MQAGWPSAPGSGAPTPAEPEQEIRYFDAFRFVFKSEDAWSNIALAFAFSLVPLVGQMALLGWYSEILQRLVQKHPKPIPKLEFGDFTHYLSRGVSAFVCAMILAMPLSIVIMVVFGVGGAVASLLTTKATRGAPPDPTPMLVLFGGVALFSMALSPIFAIVSSAVITRAELAEDLGVAFQVGKLFDQIKKTWLITLVGAVVMGILGAAITFAGLLACFVGIYPAVVIVRMASLHFRYQTYAIYLARGGEPVPIKPRLVPIPSEQQAAGR